MQTCAHAHATLLCLPLSRDCVPGDVHADSPLKTCFGPCLTSFSLTLWKHTRANKCDLEKQVFLKRNLSDSVIFPVKVNLSDRLWTL